MRPLLVGLAVLLHSVSTWAADLPEGWFLVGDAAKNTYELSIGPESGVDGPGLMVNRITKDKTSFVGVGQIVSADKYKGKKVRVSGYIRTDSVEDGYGGLWFRVDKAGGMLVLDNMRSRGVTGTTDWQSYESILFVDPSATKLVFGALLTGLGKMNVDKFGVDIVPDDTPTSVDATNPREEPINLTF